MKTVTKVTSKNYNSQSQVNYFEKGITKKEIKDFLFGNRNITFLGEIELEESTIKSSYVVKQDGELVYNELISE